MASSKTRSGHPVSQSAPTHSPIREAAERRGGRRRAKELTCETCGKVYKHPVCLQKHRWEHNPLWRETAQFLLSKHQQVQVMEAAAILVHGSSLPTDRSLWPSYMSGALASPTFGGNGDLRDSTPQYRGSSPSPTTSSVDREDPPTSQFDDEELEDASEQDDDEMTDESDAPLSAFSTDLMRSGSVRHVGRERSQSFGLSAPAPTHMPNIYGSYGWGVITDSGHHASFRSSIMGKSPLPDPTSPMPMAIPNNHGRGFLGHQSMSSFGSVAHSFGSSSTSSYIPSSSIRSPSGDDEEDDTTRLEAANGYRFAKMAILPIQAPVEARREEEFDELEMEMD